MQVIKNASRKTKVALKVLRTGGVLAFLILWVRFTEKMLLRLSRNTQSQKHLIDTKVKYRDALMADYTKPLKKWPGTKKKSLTFNWLMPPPGKGSGGHFNIFRFIQYLEGAGHTCRIYLYTQHEPGRVSDVRTLMGDSYPKLNATMTWLENCNDMQNADGIFATSWETAYAAFNAKTIGKRFYFVQDFEPYFYPAGSLSTLAENTYRFGYFGVTAGKWLATKLRDEYGMQTDYFDFSADRELYSMSNTSERKEIFFYARPYTARRGFEIGIMALDLFHKKHPEYTINFAGWDVSTYDVPFPYKNLKTLELDELGKLYNRCAAGLVMSLTNMSLLPLELLSCGTIPVVNKGANNHLVSENPYIAYTENNPAALADRLSEVVTHKDRLARARAAADSIGDGGWDQSGEKFIQIVERETRRRG
jgi:glycosyltransferase involved in cell wall biosynthesis